MTASTRLLRILAPAVLVALVAAGGTSHAATLYGTSYNGQDGLATLHRIDPATGTGVLVGPIGFQRVGGIDFGPDGRLYGVGERNDGSNVLVLLVIDTATGAGTEIAPLGGPAPSRPVTDISFRPSDGRLFAYLDSPDEHATIDRTTGAVTVLGPTGPGTGGGNGTAFSKNVTLFTIDTLGATSLYRTNQTTGANTLVGAITYVGFPPPTGLFRVPAADAQPATGTVYVVVNDNFGGGGPMYLGTLDPVAGTIRNIGPTVTDLDALAWEPDRCPGVLYGTAKSGGPTAPSSLYKLNPNLGTAALVGPVNFNGVSGIDVHPATGKMYGVGHRPADGKHVLIQIDPFTGAGTEIGPLVNAGSTGAGGIFDLSFRSDGTLFLTAFDPSATAIQLFTVSLASGLATAVGPTATLSPGNGTAFSLSNVLYHADTGGGGTLYTADQATGASTPRSPLTYLPALGGARINAMDADPGTGAIWAAINAGGAGGGPNYLGILDPRTGEVRRIGQSVNGLDGIAWRTECNDGDPCTQDQCARCEDGNLLGAVYSGNNGPASLYRIDPATGASALIGPIGFQRVSAMEFDDETGVLFATGERNDGSNVNVLLAIDPATGLGNEIGPTGIAGLGGGGFSTEPDIALRTFDGRLYAYLDLGDGVAVLDKATGAGTFIGNSGVAGFGNGFDFTTPDDRLLLADGISLDSIDQSTGAATVGPLLSYAGFPAMGNPRVNALDHNCSGRIFASVRDGGAGGPSFLATLQTTGVVTHIAPTIAGLDALAWISGHGFCKNTFVDTDGDSFCDGLDCAPADPGAWRVPPEIATDGFPNKTTYAWTSVAPIAGPGTLYDVIADPLTALPVGPGGGGESSACGFAGTAVGIADPLVGTGFWVIVRGHNVCGPGPYGIERYNNLPPFPLIQQRNTTTCP